MSCEQK